MSTKKKAAAKKAPAKPKDERRRSVVGVDNDQYDALAKRGKAKNLSISQQVREAISKYVGK